jgi:hypothetical protein
MRARFGHLFPLVALLALAFIPGGGGDDRDTPQRLLRTSADTDRNYTTIGNIGLTVTNFGTVGSRNAYWPDQPSCEYPRGSRIEHIYQGGLWVGAVSRQSGQQHVSTGATDQASASRIGRDYEFTSDVAASMTQRSTISSSRFFSEDAISHQDFVSVYTDLNRTNPTTGDTIPEHTPLKLSVRQESYAWNFPFADFFVILNYTISNAGTDTLDSVYVGFWNNGLVRNTNLVRPGTPGYFNHGANGYLDTLRMMYTFDYDGIPTPPAADSYVGIKLLGGTPFPHGADSTGDLRGRAFFNATTVWHRRYHSRKSICSARRRATRLRCCPPAPFHPSGPATLSTSCSASFAPVNLGPPSQRTTRATSGGTSCQMPHSVRRRTTVKT